MPHLSFCHCNSMYHFSVKQCPRVRKTHKMQLVVNLYVTSLHGGCKTEHFHMNNAICFLTPLHLVLSLLSLPLTQPSPCISFQFLVITLPSHSLHDPEGHKARKCVWSSGCPEVM